MLNIAICDDDIKTTGKIEGLLQDIAKRNFVDTEIEVFWNGKSLADAIAAGERWNRYIALPLGSIFILFLFRYIFCSEEKKIFVGNRYNAVRGLAIWNNNDY